MASCAPGPRSPVDPTTPGLAIRGLDGLHRVWDRVVPLSEPVARTHAIELESTASIDRNAEEPAAGEARIGDDATGLQQILDLLTAHGDSQDTPTSLSIETSSRPVVRLPALDRMAGLCHQPDGRRPLSRPPRGRPPHI